MSEIMKTDLAERIDKYMFCLSQIPQTLSEELTDTSIFQTLYRKSYNEEISEKTSRNYTSPCRRTTAKSSPANTRPICRARKNCND